MVGLDCKEKIVFINKFTEDLFNIDKNNYIGISFALFSQHLSQANSNDLNDIPSNSQHNIVTSSASKSNKFDSTICNKTMKIFHRENVVIDDIAGLNQIVIYTEATSEYEYLRKEREALSTLSHELRTPLANVLGYSELLMQEKNNEIEINEYIATINSEAKLIAELLDNIALYGKLGSQHYDQNDFVEISINSLVAAALEQISIPIGRDDVELNILNQDLNVKTDPKMFFLAFSNLVNNAYKYSQSKVSVDINIENDLLVVSIIDEGAGIAPNELNTIFNKFWRSKKASRNCDGVGLGMSIVKESLDLIGLDIDIISVLNKGTKVNILFSDFNL
jgi:signal transduction histidine kinase